MHIQGHQLVPELLLKLSDTLHKQYRYIEHLPEEVSCQTFFFLDKMTAYQTKLFCLAFVFLIVVSFIDHYCGGQGGWGGGGGGRGMLGIYLALLIVPLFILICCHGGRLADCYSSTYRNDPKFSDR